MINKFKTIGSLTLGIAVIALVSYACKKSGNTVSGRQDQERIVFEEKENNDRHTTGELFLGANVKKITAISYNHSLLDILRSSDEWKKAVAGEILELESIRRTYVHNADVSLVTIPVTSKGNTKDYFNVYLQGNKILITKLSEINAANGLTSYKVQSPQGELYYQFDLNSRNQMGNWKFEKDIPKIFTAMRDGGNTAKDEKCSKKKFYSCMNCLIIDVCGSDWLCTILCGAAVPSCVGGAALVCLVA